MWPVFAEKEVLVFNKESSIGVCTLWSPREEFVSKNLSGLIGKISLVGNLYSVFGIGTLIRNYLASPWLRYLVVTGTEIGSARDALKSLKNDSGLSKELFLDNEHIKRFLDQVKIVYVNTENIGSIIKKEEFRDDNLEKLEFLSIIVPLPEPKVEVFPAPMSGHLIRARTILEGYLALLKEIRLFGHITGQDSEGHRRQELWELNMAITNQDPCDFASVPHTEYGADKIRQYCEDFWKGAEPNDLAYRYGHIIRYGFGDQVEAVSKAFQEKAETFRTVISLWNPCVEGGSITAKDPPCLTLIHPRIIGNFLHLWAYIRTNDMFGGWSLNAAALRYFQFHLLEKLKIELNRPDLKLGELGITSGSAHIYERDWLRVDAAIKENEKITKFFPDPKGNFQIISEGDEIIVKHFSCDGRNLLQAFRGKSAEKLSAEIAPYITQIKNALYVGRELQKAERGCKKDGNYSHD